MEDKYILFVNALKAMLRLKKAIDLGFPASYIDKLDAQFGKHIDQIENRNLMDQFADFVLN